MSLSLNPKQVAEMHFWTNLVKSEGKEGFIRRRRGDFYRHMNNFNGWADLSGSGLEVGTGCFSQLEWANHSKCWGIDPLAEEYRKIEPEPNSRVKVLTDNGESIELFLDEEMDWVVCWNVIDHTPNPQYMADEIYRVLKPGGKLYFEVNFDDLLHKPHYAIWNEEMVNNTLSKFKQLYKNILRNDPDRQTLFYGVYEK